MINSLFIDSWCMQGMLFPCWFLQIHLFRIHYSGNASMFNSAKWSIIGSDNGLLPVYRQAIAWTNIGIMLIWSLGMDFSEILIKIQTFSLKKINMKMLSAKWRPFCLSHSVSKLAVLRGLVEKLMFSYFTPRDAVIKFGCILYTDVLALKNCVWKE